MNQITNINVSDGEREQRQVTDANEDAKMKSK
jgi:hypothetical protein